MKKIASINKTVSNYIKDFNPESSGTWAEVKLSFPTDHSHQIRTV